MEFGIADESRKVVNLSLRYENDGTLYLYPGISSRLGVQLSRDGTIAVRLS